MRRFRKGQVIRFDQPHLGRTFTFDGEIHSVETIQGETVYHVEVLFTDGTLWALVKDRNAELFDGRLPVSERPVRYAKKLVQSGHV